MNKKEPLLRVIKFEDRPLVRKMLIRGLAIILALAVSALFIFLVTKLNPVQVFASMFRGAFGTPRKVWITFRDASLLLLLAIGLTPAFRMRFWNTGAEGQMMIGGLISAAMMIGLGDRMPALPLILMMALAAMIGGAIWGFFPAYFKTKYQTNETLFTLMMNYVAIQLVEFFVDVWDKKQSHSVGIINLSTKGGWLPQLFGQQYLLIILIVILVTVIVAVYLSKSKQGYEVSVVGESENTAKYAGINVKLVVIRTMLISGAICGLAGFIEVAGISHTISKATAGGRGFTAIIVAWMSKLSPVVMSLSSLLIVFLNKGASQIASDFALNEYASNIITGILLFFIIGSEFFCNYKVIFRNKEGK